MPIEDYHPIASHGNLMLAERVSLAAKRISSFTSLSLSLSKPTENDADWQSLGIRELIRFSRKQKIRSQDSNFRILTRHMCRRHSFGRHLIFCPNLQWFCLAKRNLLLGTSLSSNKKPPATRKFLLEIYRARIDKVRLEEFLLEFNIFPINFLYPLNIFQFANNNKVTK